jgi:uncharacterized integral membrane protein (TIGR00697 family)
VSDRTALEGRVPADSGYLALTAFFVAFLLVSDIIAVKLVPVQLGPFSALVPAGVIAYPLTFLAADVLTEVYGLRAARRTIYLGFAAAAAMVGLLVIAVSLPAADAGAPQPAFARILGSTPRIVLGSFIAYLAGELSNAQVMAGLRQLTRGRALWLRTIGSTAVGQALDTSIFITIAFAAVPALGVSGVPSSVLLVIIGSQYAVKLAIEVLGTPLVYAAVGTLRGRRAGRGADAVLGNPLTAPD